MFNMYAGESLRVTLRVKESAMNAIVDRFGKDVQVDDAGDGTARGTLVSWERRCFSLVFPFEGQVVIEQPTSLRKTYANYLRGLLESLRIARRSRAARAGFASSSGECLCVGRLRAAGSA
ncbi:MAG: WYL domain-containing protein [Senegalimassilia faecalis]